jgi:putative membrane protein
MREKLQTLHGKAFDDQYAHDMVEDHNKAVKLFQQEERAGHNTELKQFAQKTLPTLEEHQKMAVELSRKLSQTAAR